MLETGIATLLCTWLVYTVSYEFDLFTLENYVLNELK